MTKVYTANNSLCQMVFERSQQLRGDRSVSVAIEDCWDWKIMWRKFIFRHYCFTSTKICDSKQQSHAD